MLRNRHLHLYQPDLIHCRDALLLQGDADKGRLVSLALQRPQTNSQDARAVVGRLSDLDKIKDVIWCLIGRFHLPSAELNF